MILAVTISGLKPLCFSNLSIVIKRCRSCRRDELGVCFRREGDIVADDPRAERVGEPPASCLSRVKLWYSLAIDVRDDRQDDLGISYLC